MSSGVPDRPSFFRILARYFSMNRSLSDKDSAISLLRLPSVTSLMMARSRSAVVFYEIAVGARLERRADVFFSVVYGDHEDFCAG